MVNIRSVLIETAGVAHFRNLETVFYVLNHKGGRRSQLCQVNQFVVFPKNTKSQRSSGTVGQVGTLSGTIALTMGTSSTDIAFVEWIRLEEVKCFSITAI